MSKLTQMNAANAIQTAAANPGIAGAGMGMGVGFGMGNMMANTMGQAMNQMQQQPQQSAGAPPPLPQAIQYFIAIGGKQSGPFDEQALAQMAKAGTLQRDTLVWKNGMPAWQQAGQVAEIAGVFGSTPPPIPT